MVKLLAPLGLLAFVVISAEAQPPAKAKSTTAAFDPAAIIGDWAYVSGMKVGEKVVTTGGIYGQLTRVGDKSVQLQVADKIRIEVAKAAIGGYQGQSPVVEPSEQ